MPMQNKQTTLPEKHMLIIFGPTAVGKTDFALKLAELIPAEIINMDMGQFYTPLSIGTAKPDWQHEKTPHHLFDILNSPENFTVTQYRAAVINKLEEIWAQHKLPILVGGSGFYLKSLLFPLHAEVQDVSGIDLEALYPPGIDLWQELYTIDPDRAKMIDPNDTYRIERALKIWHATGQRPSKFQPAFDPPASFDLVYLTRDRKSLYDRIDERVVQMIKQGLIEESEQLINTPWEKFIQRKKIIGYPDMFDYLRDKEKVSLEKCISRIQKKSRNYAKRQATFWRMLKNILEKNKQSGMHQLHEFNLTSSDLELYIKSLQESLNQRQSQRIGSENK